MPEIISERIARIRTTGHGSMILTLTDVLGDMGMEIDDGLVVTLLDDKTIVIKVAFRQKDILKNSPVLNETRNTTEVKEEAPKPDTNFP